MTERTRRRLADAAGVGLLLATCAVPVQVLAQAPETAAAGTPDTLFFGGEFVGVAPGPRGMTGAFEWLHPLTPKRSINTGVLTFTLGDSVWTYGRAGAMWRFGDSTAVHGQVDLGAGREGEDGFGYLTLRGTLSHELLARRLTLELEDHYVHINTTVGHSGRVGLTFRPAQHWAVGAAVHSSLGTALGVQAVTVRIARDVHNATLFGGLSAGRWRPALIGLAGEGPAEHTYDVFAGAVIPIDRFSLTLAFDSLQTVHARKHSVVLNWKLPLS